jgi:hypothetical protein
MVVPTKLILLEVKVANSCLLPLLFFSSANCLTASLIPCSVNSLSANGSISLSIFASGTIG